MFRRTSLLLVALLTLGLIATACGDDDTDDGETLPRGGTTADDLDNRGDDEGDEPNLPTDPNAVDDQADTRPAYLLFNGGTYAIGRPLAADDPAFDSDALTPTGQTGDFGGDIVEVYTDADGLIFTRSDTENLEPGDPELWFEWVPADPDSEPVDPADNPVGAPSEGLPPNEGPQPEEAVLEMFLEHDNGYVVGDYVSTALNPDFDESKLVPTGDSAWITGGGGDRNVEIFTHIDDGGVWSLDSSVETEPGDPHLWILWSPAN